jgi:hypothetical protein
VIGRDDDDLIRRALGAYYRSGGFDIPAGESGVVMNDGLVYVRLFNGSRVLAVYRLDNAGRLKRLKRWPKPVTANLGMEE